MPDPMSSTAPERANPGTSSWRRFRRLWGATAAANLADGLLLSAAPLLLLQLSQNPLVVTGLVAARYAPWLIMAVPLGVLADRYESGLLMRAANITRIGTLLSLGILALVGSSSVLVLYVVVLISGIAEVLYDTTSTAAVPRVVASGVLERATGRLQTTYTVMNSFVGPPVGSVLFAVAAFLPFLAGSAIYLASVPLLLGLRVSIVKPQTAERASFQKDLGAGFSALRASRLLIVLCWLAAIGNFASAAAYGLIPLVVVQQLGLPAAAYGFLLAGGAVGATLGGTIGVGLAQKMRFGPMLLWTTVISGVCVALIGYVGNPYLISFLMAVDGFVVLAQSVLLVSARSRLTPQEMLGRVTSCFRMFSTGAAVLGALAGGFAATHLGLNIPFLACGVLLVITAVVATASLTSPATKQVLRDVVQFKGE